MMPALAPTHRCDICDEHTEYAVSERGLCENCEVVIRQDELEGLRLRAWHQGRMLR